MTETHTKKSFKPNYFAIAVTVLLVFALGYIVVDKYQQGQNNKLNTVYQQGILAGQQQALYAILADVNSKGATAITAPTQDNKTITIPLIAQQTIVASLNEKGFFPIVVLDENNTQVQHQLITAAYCGQLIQQQSGQAK